MGLSGDFGDRPNRIPWPPIIYIAAILAGSALERIHPAAFPAIMLPVCRSIGVVMILVGVAVDAAAMVQMRLRSANILPHRAATALVTTGMFAMSRNPVYLGNTIAVAGAALAFDNAFFLAAALLAAAAVERMAIRREEAHLAARFGDVWSAYAARTNRWFGRSG